MITIDKLTEQQQLAIAARQELARRELERRKIKNDLKYFIQNYVYIENKDGKTPEERSILFKLFPEQLRALDEMIKHKLNIVIKARQLGITWLIISYALHECFAIQQFTVAILSQTEDYMKEAIDRFEYILIRLPKWFIQEKNKETESIANLFLYEKKSAEITIYHPVNEQGIRVESSIKGLVSTERAGQSLTVDLLLFDEWARHDNAEAVFSAAYPTINRPNSGKFIGVSTNERGSYFEEIVTDCLDSNDFGFHLIFLSWKADPRRTKEWHEQTKKTLKNTWMLNYPEKIEDALSAGEMTAFPEFSREIHVCDPFPIPEHWIKWGSVDNGLGGVRDPYCWFKAAISEDGTTYLYYEYTCEKGKGDIVYYSDQAKKFMEDCLIDLTEEGKQEIESLHLGYNTDSLEFTTKENLQYVVFGLDAFNKDTAKGTGKSLMDIYREAGFNYPAVRANTDRKLGKDIIHEYLKPYPNGIDGKKTAKLQIFSTCKYIIKHLPKLTVDPNNPDVIAGNSAIDNTADALKYLLIGSPRHNTKPIEQPENIIQRHKREKIKRLKKGRRKGIIN